MRKGKWAKHICEGEYAGGDCNNGETTRKTIGFFIPLSCRLSHLFDTYGRPPYRMPEPRRVNESQPFIYLLRPTLLRRQSPPNNHPSPVYSSSLPSKDPNCCKSLSCEPLSSMANFNSCWRASTIALDSSTCRTASAALSTS